MNIFEVMRTNEKRGTHHEHVDIPKLISPQYYALLFQTAFSGYSFFRDPGRAQKYASVKENKQSLEK